MTTSSAGQAQSLNDVPVPHEVHEVGHSVNSKLRWTGSAWEPAGAEGVASVPTPRQHEDVPVAVDPRK